MSLLRSIVNACTAVPKPGFGGFFVPVGRSPNMAAITLTRLCQYARQHQEQARTAGDEFRVELWNGVLDQLIDRRIVVAE